MDVFENDIILTTVGSRPPMYNSMVGKAITVPKNATGSLLNQNMVVLRSNKDKLTQDFLGFVLRSKQFIYFIETLIRGNANQVSIALNDFFKHSFLLPPLPEQTAIASLLSAWDEAIEKTEKLIERKLVIKRGLMQQLLSGKKRLENWKTRGLTEERWFKAPDDWKVVRIEKFAQEVSIKNNDGNDIPVLSCTKHHGLVDSLKYFDKQVFSKDTSAYKIVEKSQFAYATNHIEEGSIGYQDLYPKGLVSPMYTVFKTDSKMVNDGYLYKLLKTETFRHIFQANTSASVDRRGSLRWKDFSHLFVPLPPIDEQDEINEVLETAQQEIDLRKKQLEALKKQKRGLMQKLLTGQWRVKVPRD